MCIRVEDLVYNRQFDITAWNGIRIIQFGEVENEIGSNIVTVYPDGTQCGCTTVYEGKFPYMSIPIDVLIREVTGINVTCDGWLEIEYSGDEYMGPA